MLTRSSTIEFQAHLLYRKNRLSESSLMRHFFIATIFSFTLCLASCGGGGSSDNVGPVDQFPFSPAIEIESVGVSQVGLKWAPIDNATGYRVYFATQQGVTPQNYRSLPNSGMQTNAVPLWLSLESEIYYVIVTAVNQYGESLPSNEISVRPWGTVTGMTMRPSKRALMPGTYQWFALDGIVSGGQLRDVTERAVWSSSDPTVVSIGQILDGVQYVQGVSAGKATITAEVDGVVSSADIVVWPITMLEEQVPFSTGANTPSVGIDDNGHALAAWAYPLAGELRVFGHDNVNGWTGPTLLDPLGDRVEEQMLAVAGSGFAHMVWHGLNGVYSAQYIPTQGWQSTQMISNSGENIKVAIGADGNGVAVWTVPFLDPADNRVMTASYTSGAGWTTPVELGHRGSAASPVTIAGNQSGTAVAVWENYDWAVNSWELSAAIYQSGIGWGTPVILTQQTSYSMPNVDIAEDGTIAVVWLDDMVNSGLHISRFQPGIGWLASEEVSPGAAIVYPQVAVSDGGDVMVGWVSNGSYDLVVRHRLPVTGWEPSQTLVDAAFGGRTLHLATKGAGSYVALEVGARIISEPTWARIHNYETGAGWRPEEILHAGKGTFEPSALSTSPSGQTIIGWNEHYDIYTGLISSTYEDLLTLIYP